MYRVAALGANAASATNKKAKESNNSTNPFSQSLDIGNSTLLNLDSEARHAIAGNVASKAPDVLEKEELEVVQESPTQVLPSESLYNGSGVSTLGRTRTQRRLLHKSDVNDKERRRFRRSKSDSTLPKPVANNTACKATEHFTELLRNGFTFSITADEKNSKHDSMLRVSQIEAALQEFEMLEQFTEDKQTNNNLDVAIFSDDVKALLENNQSKTEEQKLDRVWGETLPVEKFELQDSPMEDVDKVMHLDTTSFVCPVLQDVEARQQLHEDIERSRREIIGKKEISFTEHHLHTSINSSTEFEFQKKAKRAKKSCAKSAITQIIKSATTSSQSNGVALQEFESLKHISAWNLPRSVVQEYEKKGVIKMFDWQIECLSNPKILFEHCNLVYSAPTSAGKSLVSEILLLKTVLERSRKVLFILPFISVVREKMFYLQDLLTVAGYRVEGFFGGYTPPGGFDSIHVAICTIEKANSIVNKLLENNKLDEIGTIVVDEVHLISDPGRGYILELLLAKVLYMSRKYGLQIQVVTMSATLANVELLKRWLDAELYITDFRPVALQEMIKIGNKIYDCHMHLLRDVTQPLTAEEQPFPTLPNDGEHVAQLCIETLLEGCSVIVFCPSKDWCENLAVQLASAIQTLCSSDSTWSLRLRSQLKQQAIEEVKRQLQDIPTGLDSVLEKTISSACAFHHAGLTSEERDVIEASFKSGALKIIVATSTLSSGVNLPARRVLIRSPLFGGKQMNSLTYRQMIGRAGRTGKDTLGESILVCTDKTARVGRELITADLKPISSCLELDSSTHLKRALLEVISSGVASTKEDIDSFVNCTLLSAEKQLSEQGKDKSADEDSSYINDALNFLIEYEFIRLQQHEETKEQSYVATRLGLACLAASMPPTDGLILFAELQKSRRCFVLESELHAVYLVTPYSVCYQVQDLDWLFFLDLWEKLPTAMKKVGELVGIKESFLVRAMRGQSKLDYKLMQIHKRFYTALALQELVNEVPINAVAYKYKCTRGMLQSLQQMASTFAGIVTAFCNSLQWPTLSLIVSQFKERLYFGVHRDLIDLMRLPDLNHKRARALFDGGVTSLVELANEDVLEVEKILFNAMSFDSAKQHEYENAYEAEQRNQARNFFITGKLGLTIAEGAKLLVQEARKFVQYEIGVSGIKWTQEKSEAESTDTEQLHMSCEEDMKDQNNRKRNSSGKDTTDITPPKMNKVEVKVEKNSWEHMDKPSTSKNALETLKRTQASKSRHATGSTLEIKPKQITSSGNSYKNTLAIESKDLKHNKDIIANNNEITATNKSERDNKVKIDNLAQPITDKIPLGTTSGTGLNKPLQVAASALEKNSEQTENAGRSDKNTVGIKNKNLECNKEGITSKNQAVEANKAKQRDQLKINDLAQGQPQHANKENQTDNFGTAMKTQIRKASPSSKSDTFYIENRRITRRSNEKNVQQAKQAEKEAYPQTSKQTSNSAKLPQPRRSPRNHKSNINAFEQHKQPTQGKVVDENKSMEQLFMSDDSFELNTGVHDALAIVENFPKPMTTVKVEQASVVLNRSKEEVPSSQQLMDVIDSPMTSKQSVHTSRFLRTTQRSRAQKAVLTKKETAMDAVNNYGTSNDTSPPTTSMEFSELSIDNSLIKNPVQLNASHILSCSKEDADGATHFNRVEIVDICGNENLFKLAFEELMSAKRLGFCLGLQQQTNKRKPLIGANLLINQAANNESAQQDALLFQIDDTTYVEGCAFCISDNIVYYMNLQVAGTYQGLTAAVKEKYLCDLLKMRSHTLLCVDAKEQLKMLCRAMPQLKEVHVELEDPKVANWLLQPDKLLSIQQMTQQFAPECSALIGLCGSGRGYSSFGLDTASAILAKIRCTIEACVTIHVLHGQIENLQRIGTGQLYKFFKEIEMPLQRSLYNMELFGFPAAESALRNLFQQMVETMKKLEGKIYDLHGARFNLGSSTAVAKVLGLHRKASGRVSTSRQILEKIDSPMTQLIIAYRKLSTTLAKNIQPLLKCVQNNRIHCQSITFTQTGRIAMTEPNLQNVAKDFIVDFGTECVTISCRSAFFPNKSSNRCLLSSDFCQLEMRILAHLSQDATLLRVMNTEQDIFTAIAARWNKIAESTVSEELRNGTKQICYGIVYGMGMRSLADALKCTEQEATSLCEQFHLAYPGIRTYADKIAKFARNNGYIETITGRRRYLEQINSGEPHLKSQAERQAINSTIQGSAADIAKSAILRMEKNIEKYRDKLGLRDGAVRLILHLHDELIFEVPADKAKKIAKVLSLTMENCVKLSVPLKVRLKTGKSWGDLKEIKL